jgi:hypothetical protein
MHLTVIAQLVSAMCGPARMDTATVQARYLAREWLHYFDRCDRGLCFMNVGQDTVERARRLSALVA